MTQCASTQSRATKSVGKSTRNSLLTAGHHPKALPRGPPPRSGPRVRVRSGGLGRLDPPPVPQHSLDTQSEGVEVLPEKFLSLARVRLVIGVLHDGHEAYVHRHLDLLAVRLPHDGLGPPPLALPQVVLPLGLPQQRPLWRVAGSTIRREDYPPGGVGGTVTPEGVRVRGRTGYGSCATSRHVVPPFRG